MVEYNGDVLIPSAKATFQISVMGFTRTVAEALTAAGFAHVAFEQALLYGLPLETPVRLPPSVTIEAVTDGWRESAMEGVRKEVSPGTYRFLARCEGKPAGVGVLRVDEDGTAHVVGGAVVPLSTGRFLLLGREHFDGIVPWSVNVSGTGQSLKHK